MSSVQSDGLRFRFPGGEIEYDCMMTSKKGMANTWPLLSKIRIPVSLASSFHVDLIVEPVGRTW